jgi:hypothetical protein
MQQFYLFRAVAFAVTCCSALRRWGWEPRHGLADTPTVRPTRARHRINPTPTHAKPAARVQSKHARRHPCCSAPPCDAQRPVRGRVSATATWIREVETQNFASLRARPAHRPSARGRERRGVRLGWRHLAWIHVTPPAARTGRGAPTGLLIAAAYGAASVAASVSVSPKSVNCDGPAYLFRQPPNHIRTWSVCSR